MTDPTLIFACGNPMLDMAANLGKGVMEKYDLPYGGAVLAEEKHEPLFTEIMAHPTLQITAGGSALNTVRCATVSFLTSVPFETEIRTVLPLLRLSWRRRNCCGSTTRNEEGNPA